MEHSYNHCIVYIYNAVYVIDIQYGHDINNWYYYPVLLVLLSSITDNISKLYFSGLFQYYDKPVAALTYIC